MFAVKNKDHMNSIFQKSIHIVKLLRPKHSIKNILVFIPLLFGSKFFNLDVFLDTFCGFLIFSITSSMIYVINDLNDIEKDRKHPKKKNRPLASGDVSKKEAYIIIVFLAISILLLSLISKLSPVANILILVYLLVNICYSAGLKNVPILDIILLASGFLLRLFFGSEISHIEISPLLYLVVLFGAFYLGASKRYNEIIKTGSKTRSVLKKYTEDYLKSIMNIFMVMIIIFYTQWCIEAKHQNLHLISIPIFIILLIYYMYVADKDSFGDPIEVIMKNKPLIGLALFLGVYLMIVIRL